MFKSVRESLQNVVVDPERRRALLKSAV